VLKSSIGAWSINFGGGEGAFTGARDEDLGLGGGL
jgi:hypothetical protein